MSRSRRSWLVRTFAPALALAVGSSAMVVGGSVQAGASAEDEHERLRPAARFSTFNASLNRFTEGELVADLSTPDDAQAAAVAEIIQRVRPDVPVSYTHLTLPTIYSV